MASNIKVSVPMFPSAYLLSTLCIFLLNSWIVLLLKSITKTELSEVCISVHL